MKTTLIALLALVGLASHARADETYTFSCIASRATATGKISTLQISEDGASLDGVFLEVDESQAANHQSVVNSQNKYVSGKQALVLTAEIVESKTISNYDGYPKHDAQHVVSSVYSSMIAVRQNAADLGKYTGVCSETYSGD